MEHAVHFLKHIMCINLFNFCNNPVKVFFSNYKWESEAQRGLELCPELLS